MVKRNGRYRVILLIWSREMVDIELYFRTGLERGRYRVILPIWSREKIDIDLYFRYGLERRLI